MKLELGQAGSAEHVDEWRREQLLRSGFSERQARFLARDGRFDLHRLIELVEHGCPPDLAVRILAPLDDPAAKA